MAAICGIWGAADRCDLEKVAGRLCHRGGDPLGWGPGAHVEFVWRRDAGAPVVPVASRAPLIFTGAILNRDELAQRVGRRGNDRVLRDDAELLWNLYRMDGSAAFARINGQFAVALYDGGRDEIVLATDRWAAQPLYFVRVTHCWAFATEYRALLGLLQLEAQVDTQSLAFLREAKYLPLHRGLLANVYPVAPGEVVRLSRKECERQAYTPLAPAVTDGSAPAGGLRMAMIAAARSATEQYERIGVALDSGPDSMVTLGLVRKVAPDASLHTYTVAFHADDPERRRADDAARYFRTLHTDILLAPHDLPALLSRFVWAMEDPCSRTDMLAHYLMAREAGAEVPILLCGATRNHTETAAIERLHARAGAKFASLFHDVRVAGWLFHAPGRLRLGMGRHRRILRVATQGIVPARFVAPPGHDLRIALDGRWRRAIDEMAGELLAPSVVAMRGLFNPADVARLLRRWRSDEEFHHVWTLLLFETWCRLFIDGVQREVNRPANEHCAARSPDLDPREFQSDHEQQQHEPELREKAWSIGSGNETQAERSDDDACE